MNTLTNQMLVYKHRALHVALLSVSACLTELHKQVCWVGLRSALSLFMVTEA